MVIITSTPVHSPNKLRASLRADMLPVAAPQILVAERAGNMLDKYPLVRPCLLDWMLSLHHPYKRVP